MTQLEVDFPDLGAIADAEGRTAFCVWAPAARSVAVEVHGSCIDLVAGDAGMFDGQLSVRHGADYLFVLNGHERRPDPCSRWQPDGLLGPSRILEPGGLRRDVEGWNGVALEDLVIYELNVGTFSPPGSFDGIVARLSELRDLGVTAIELMPVATYRRTTRLGVRRGIYVRAAPCIRWTRGSRASR